MCPNCNCQPIQNIMYTDGRLLCVECSLAASYTSLERFRRMPPIYSAYSNYRPDLFPGQSKD